MSHDCDCGSCQETDSRWAYARRLTAAKENDCPKGKHIAELWSTRPGPDEYEYRCAACRIWTTQKGVAIKDAQALANRALALIGAPVCPEHQRYQAKRRPRLSCEGCWRRYIFLNPT